MMTDEQKREIERLWGEGYSIPQMAKRMGVGEGKVKNYVARHRSACPKRIVKYSKATFESVGPPDEPLTSMDVLVAIAERRTREYARGGRP